MSLALREWLQANDLAEFESLLVANEVDLKALQVLTEADLKELGLAFGPRKRFLNALAEAKKQPVPRRNESETAFLTVSQGERRQLTVMFCDLVGSTALSTRLDLEELHHLIKRYHKTCADIVVRYEGHVAKYMGDGIMAYFGWPVALEDAAERGVRSALEIVKAVEAIRAANPLVVRIGLATGSVVVGEIAPDGMMEAAMVVGQTPNLAARLQALAGPGEVVIASTTRRLLADAFVLTDMGARELKGFSEPMQVWRVEGQRRTEGRFTAAHGEVELAPIVGRYEETTLLARRWHQAKSGQGQVVLIGGQPGIGKSRLLQELRKTIVGPHAPLYYQCSPYHLNSPLHPFIEQFELSAGFAHDDTPERRLEKLETALGNYGALVPDAAPLYAALHSLPVARYPALNLSPRKQKEKTLEALAGRIEVLTKHAPVLMVVEDVHWIDPTSQELLELLIPKVQGLSILIVMTYRLEYVPPWSGRPSVTNLTLNRLGRQQALQLVHTVTGGKALPPEVLDEILVRTDGVPLFVEELTRSVLESGQLRARENHYELDGSLRGLAIPASLRDLLMARLDRLGAVKEVAQIGACIGREFSYDLLERISGQRAEELGTSLQTLVDSGLVSRHDSPPTPWYAFKHALIQDAAYDSLLKTQRCELHGRIAQVLESDFAERARYAPEWLAHHHTQAGHLARAIPLWREAGIQAAERVALKEAAAHYQKGLSLCEQLPASPERDGLELTIREPLNAAWTGLRGWAAPEVGSNATAILRLAEAQGNRRSLLLAMWWVWTSTITQGRIADSRLWVDRLLAIGRETEDLDLQIFGHATAMVQHFLSGRLVESRDQAEKALALYDPNRADQWIKLTGHDLRTFVEVYACQLTWMLGYPDTAARQSEEARSHAYTVGHAFNLVWALTFSSYVYAYRREPEAFWERVHEADRLAREQGLSFIYEVSVPQARGIVELQNGHSREAISLLRQGIERWTRTGGKVRVPLLKAALAEATALEGNPGAALELIDECLDQIQLSAGQEKLWLAEVLRCKGWILTLLNRDTEAETLLRAALDCARQQKARSWELRAANALATLLARQGHPALAEDILKPVYDWFTEGKHIRDQIEARELLAKLSILVG